ncbi:MAG TPA: MFS transporter [Candidatus Paceibacterota bacterium]|nr:MFS transporter [Candidatus Paceibacterota bacterium]
MRINPVIRYLVIADFFVNAGFSFFAPVLAIFITGQIKGGTIEAVGIGTAIVQIIKVVFELPIARILDRNHGEYDDYVSLVFGAVLITLVPFLYLLASTITHMYIIQAIYGLGIAFVLPPWYAIFSRHVDPTQESFEWTLDSVSIGIAAAAAAAAGGFLAQRFGFDFVFLAAGALAILGGVLQCKIFRYLKSKVSRGQVRPVGEKV